jgi:hypothetical protein
VDKQKLKVFEERKQRRIFQPKRERERERERQRECNSKQN